MMILGEDDWEHKEAFLLSSSSHPLSGLVVHSGSSSFARHLRGREKKLQLEPGRTTGNSPVINAEVESSRAIWYDPSHQDQPMT